MSPDTSPHEQFSAQAHHAEIQQRTIIVRIASPDVQQRVFEQLRFGSHRSSKGRYLANDIPGLTLQAGDRLEPCKELRNIGQFETQTCPFTCRFWRGESTDRITHDSPLMSIEGVSLDSTGWTCCTLGHWAVSKYMLGSSSGISSDVKCWAQVLHG